MSDSINYILLATKHNTGLNINTSKFIKSRVRTYYRTLNKENVFDKISKENIVKEHIARNI